MCIILSSKAYTWQNLVELLQDLLITYAEDFEQESDWAFSFIRTIFFSRREDSFVLLLHCLLFFF